MRRKSEDVPDWGNIREMNEEELKRFLDSNQDIDPHLLAIICSEILRRWVNER